MGVFYHQKNSQTLGYGSFGARMREKLETFDDEFRRVGYLSVWIDPVTDNDLLSIRSGDVFSGI